MKALIYSFSLAALAFSYNSSATAATISRWSAENNALDSIGNNDGTLVNGTTFGADKSGKLFSLDGIDDYVNVSDSSSLDISSAITIAAWVNPSGTSSHRIVDKITAGSDDGYLLDILNERLRMIIDGQILLSTSTLSIGSFQHVAGVYDGQVIRLYINGIEDASVDIGSVTAIPTNALDLRIGADSNGQNVFAGKIDEVNLFNSALSASEINDLANGVTNVPEPSSLGLILGAGILACINQKVKLRK